MNTMPLVWIMCAGMFLLMLWFASLLDLKLGNRDKYWFEKYIL